MTDDTTIVPVENPLLTESKFYTLARIFPLLDFLSPDLPTKMMIETEVDAMMPREEEDGYDTRILINYRNLKGNASLFKLNDDERILRRFHIDHFMNGYMASVMESQGISELPATDPKHISNIILLALNMGVTTVLGLNAGADVTQETVLLSQTVVQSLIALLFDDALDVMVAVQELPLKEGQEQTDSVIVGLWPLKTRHVVLPSEVVVNAS